MCIPWFLFKKDIPLKKFDGFFPCACNICGRNFENMEKFIKHSGFHSIEDINTVIYTQFGTVRCGKCFRSFSTVEVMAEHSCATVIEGLSPIASSGSLDSILIHDTYTQEDNHRNS
jgi:hypothetical protein